MSGDWNHRTDMDDHDSGRTKSITEAVDKRIVGETHYPTPTSSECTDESNTRDPADEWEDRFPDSWFDDDDETTLKGTDKL
jgi:hypothetical protein